MAGEHFEEPAIAWRDSAAREILLSDLRAGNVPLTSDGGMTLQQVYDSREEYKAYDRSKFSDRLSRARKKIKKEKTATVKEKSKWGKSAARKLLLQDLRRGRIPLEPTEAEDLEAIFIMRPEYCEFDFEKFNGRLSDLRELVLKEQSHADSDQVAFQRFVHNHPTISLFSRLGTIQWQGSPAQKLLRQDLKEDRHKNMSTRDLYGSRPEFYNEFPIKMFRDCLRQEIKTAKYLHTLKVKGKRFKAS